MFRNVIVIVIGVRIVVMAIRRIEAGGEVAENAVKGPVC